MANLVSELVAGQGYGLYEKLEATLAHPQLANFLAPDLDAAALYGAKTAADRVVAQAQTMSRPNLFERAFSFDLHNDFAREWAQQRAGWLVRYIGSQTRETVGRLISQAVTVGFTPEQTARRIRRQVGLLPAQSQTLDRFLQRQLAAGVKAEVADRHVAEYANRMLTQRSQTIALTETLAAQNHGQLLLWQRKAAAKQIPSNVMRMWIITRDDRTCPRCSQMTGDRAFAPLHGDFYFPGPRKNGGSTYVQSPPGHPRCRCSHSLWIPEFMSPEEQTAVLSGSDAGLRVKAVSQ
jgi:hypothetical protein